MIFHFGTFQIPVNDKTYNCLGALIIFLGLGLNQNAFSIDTKQSNSDVQNLTSTNQSTTANNNDLKKSPCYHPDTPPCLTWINSNKEPLAAILCVHGLGLYNGTYKDFGERMSALGYAVYAVDVRGFGSWKEAAGREKVDFQGCLEDVHKTLRVMHKVHPHLSIFILGESMGGAIALRATCLYPQLVDGLISSVPGGDRFKQYRTAFKVGLHLLAGPNREFNIGKSIVAQATDNPQLQEEWSNDPLARMNLSPAELIQFQSFMNENHDCARNITTTPVLMVQGAKDHLVKPQGTKTIYEEIASPDKRLELISDAEHLIFEEGQFNDQIIKLTDDWLKAHKQKK